MSLAKLKKVNKMTKEEKELCAENALGGFTDDIKHCQICNTSTRYYMFSKDIHINLCEAHLGKDHFLEVLMKLVE